MRQECEIRGKDLNAFVYKIWDLTLGLDLRFVHHWMMMMTMMTYLH